MATLLKFYRHILVVLALTTLLILILLPSLRPPRELDGTPASRIAANLRGIAQSCAVYSADNGEHFPPHLACLYITGAVAPKQFVNPGMPPITVAIPSDYDWRTIAAEFGQQCAYIYLGADLPDFSVDSDVIFLYTKKSRLVTNGRIIAFADAHAEFIPDANLPKVFAASNAARAKLGLPPNTLDVSPPVGPK